MMMRMRCLIAHIELCTDNAKYNQTGWYNIVFVMHF